MGCSILTRRHGEGETRGKSNKVKIKRKKFGVDGREKTVSSRVVVDTSVLVGLIDSQDSLHNAGVALQDALKVVQARLVYFECVVLERLQAVKHIEVIRARNSRLVKALERISYLLEVIEWIKYNRT